MKKAKLIAFIIRLKQYHVSGWVPFGCKETAGLSKGMYKKLFNEAIESGHLRKANRGYFISNFNLSLSRILQFDNTRFVKIYDKSGNFNSLVEKVLISIAHFKIRQQYVSAKKTILENKGRSCIRIIKTLIKESVTTKIRISSHQIGKFLGVSHVTANQIINKMKRMRIIKIRKPNYSSVDSCRLSSRTGMWLCQREVIDVTVIGRDLILNPLIM